MNAAHAGGSIEYQVLFDMLPFPAWVFDMETLRFASVNHAAVQRYGYSRDEFLAMTLADIRPAEEVGLFHDAMAEQRVTPTLARGSWRHRTKAGDIFDVEIIAQALPSAGEHLALAIAIDISERRQAQEALYHSRRRLQAIFDTALDAMLLLNDEGRYVDANPAACGLYGRPRDEILSMHVWDVAPDGALEATRELWRRFLREGTASGDYTMKGGDGTHRDIEYRAVANVLPGLHLAILRDVTARNAARRETEQSLRDLNEQIRRVSARARARREEDRTRLARELHDQLGQALAALKIDLCWLRDRVGHDIGNVGDDRSPDEIGAKITAMTALVDETIVRVRRLSSELRPPVLDRLGLAAAIEWQIEEFSRRTGIHVRLRSRVEHVDLDRGRSTAVFRIFQEALSNVAIHAAATQVTVRLAQLRGYLVLSIADNGRGIPRDQVQRGQSLGLIGMRERAELLSGKLDVRPGRPRGTVVTLTVPLAERRRAVRDPWP